MIIFCRFERHFVKFAVNYLIYNILALMLKNAYELNLFVT